VRNLLGAPPVIGTTQGNLLAIKEGVNQAIKARNEGSGREIGINPDDVKILRQSADLNVDPVSCFLLGDAIFHRLIPAHMYDEGDIEYGAETGGDEGMFLACVSFVTWPHRLFGSQAFARGIEVSGTCR
jgi:hypothetical protein